MDESDEINLAVVQTEYELERAKWNLKSTPENSTPVAKSKLGCGGLLLRLVLGLLLFQLILEIINIVGNLVFKI